MLRAGSPIDQVEDLFKIIAMIAKDDELEDYLHAADVTPGKRAEGERG